MVSASLLAVIMSVCVAAFTTAMTYLLKNKIKIKGRMNIKSRKGCMTRTSGYEDVRHDNTGRLKSAIDTKKNVDYGQGITLSTVVSQ